MQNILPPNMVKLKRSVYYQPADLSVLTYEGEPVPAYDPRELEQIADQSKLAYYTTLKHLAESHRRVEEGLVNKIAVAVSMSMPELSAERLQHALFAKQMFIAGEYAFAEYIAKMRNLFPSRMEGLSESLKQQIAQRLGA